MSARFSAWLLPVIVLLGLGLRTFHYLRCPSVWHDEAALIVNVVELSYLEQLGPLLWHEAAPPLFLWVERALFQVFGDSIQVLRLLPFLASCGTLLLLVPIARRLVPTAAVPWVVLLYACGEKMAWHACEAKPYAVDAFLGALLLYLFCTGDRRSLPRQLLLFTLLAPPLIFVSFPAVFLLGGLLLALLPLVRRERSLTSWLAYCLLGLVVLASFAVLVLGPVQAQRHPHMDSCWTNFFPNWSRPLSVPFWTVMATCEVFRYCFMPLGMTLVGFAVVGGVLLWRGGQREVLTFLVVPLLLALVAAFLHRYPFGGARVMLYTAPALAVLIGAGVPAVLEWVRSRSRVVAVAALILLLLPGLQSLRRIAAPWQRAETGPASEYVLRHRAADDLVLGNDWSHVYYLRQLGDRFHHFVGAAPSYRGSARAWIVYTSQADEATRLKEAAFALPAHWRVLQRREFAFTTVLLASGEKESTKGRGKSYSERER